MNFFHMIRSLFRPPKRAESLTDAEKMLRWQLLQEDIGEFVFEEDGFRYPFKEHDEKVKWSEIERIVAYKLDLMTTDEVCVELFLSDWSIRFTESMRGWYQFVKKLNLTFPSLQDGWDWEITQPPFATNYKVMYEREDRKMPLEKNFYVHLKITDPEIILALFRKPVWYIRKAGRAEWEITNTWAELHLEPETSGMLLNGLVAYHPDNVAILNQMLDGVGAPYQYEFYDIGKNLPIERRYP